MCLRINQPLVALRAAIVGFRKVQGLSGLALGSVFAADLDLVPDTNIAQLVRLCRLRPVRLLGHATRSTLAGTLGVLAAAAAVESARDGLP